MHYKSEWIAQAVLCLCIQNASCNIGPPSPIEPRNSIAAQVVIGDMMAETFSQAATSVLNFKTEFQLLGPFQIGTRGMSIPTHRSSAKRRTKTAS
jgi:hypothetical protein